MDSNALDILIRKFEFEKSSREARMILQWATEQGATRVSQLYFDIALSMPSLKRTSTASAARAITSESASRHCG